MLVIELCGDNGSRVEIKPRADLSGVTVLSSSVSGGLVEVEVSATGFDDFAMAALGLSSFMKATRAARLSAARVTDEEPS